MEKIHPFAENRLEKILKIDSLLIPYEKEILKRINNILVTEEKLTQGKMSLSEFASGHEYFGLHFRDNKWIFREWVPNASKIYLIGNMTDWKEKEEFALGKINNDGVWAIEMPSYAMNHGDHFRLKIIWDGGSGDRIPAYARRVVQDHSTLIFNAQVWKPEPPYKWRYPDFKRSKKPPIIYEAHIGMAQEDERVGTFIEFTDKILPKIASLGYNTIQLMAIQEHPYYGSFGYHVSNFFAVSSRFGTPYELKELIDTAHELGLSVLMDIVHSHSVSNEIEGLSRFDGTFYQYFHDGKRGIHEAWDSRCFDYGKHQVLHFLLSNCRFWLDEFHLDGFRFDGITSMLYLHHGLGMDFVSYNDYFNENIDIEAYTYLALANAVIHDLRSDAVTIAEDVSGMPGIGIPIDHGGLGFDFRFAMNVPDYWIKLVKESKDEFWHMGHLWFELTNRRKDEKTISYCESHDQALVGDQTLIFRIIGSKMYDRMNVWIEDIVVDRGISLHKLIRLITIATSDYGYLNFMGNEFGHPEWIDFPRKDNGWSYKYARRQWSLLGKLNLRYRFLYMFDKDMISFINCKRLLEYRYVEFLYEQNYDKILAFHRGGIIFVFNFHPTMSYVDYQIACPAGKYKILINTDDRKYGGHGRIDNEQDYFTMFIKREDTINNYISLYLPNRTALVLERVD
ncbi:MAG: alpha amylase C-terminal domain-containing protein [Desulfobacterales bacterium]|nr:alpha amylase C-terminal domain-containing protein [Desulfobacterales bacterium]